MSVNRSISPLCSSERPTVADLPWLPDQAPTDNGLIEPGLIVSLCLFGTWEQQFLVPFCGRIPKM